MLQTLDANEAHRSLFNLHVLNLSRMVNSPPSHLPLNYGRCLASINQIGHGEGRGCCVFVSRQDESCKSHRLHICRAHGLRPLLESDCAAGAACLQLLRAGCVPAVAA
jgi:hypothetical protein